MMTTPATAANAVLRRDASRGCRRRVARVLLGSAAVGLWVSPAATALGRERFVAAAPSRGSFPLVARGVAVPIVVDAQDHAGVRRAAGDLQQDVERVTGARPELREDTAPKGPAVVVGTMGKSGLIDRLVQQGKLDVREIRGRWESSLIQVVERPWPGTDRALVIVGSDKRGTIFGVYDVSEEIGVSPWYWWADVPVRHREALHVLAGRHLRAEPKVKYRGIFLNDEAPALTQKLQPGPGLRYAVSFDDEAPQVVSVHADGSLTAWEKTVADGVTVLRSKHVIAAPGPHVLKLWAMDPALVVEKLLVDTGGLRPSYLGPPESVHRLAPESPAGPRAGTR